GVRLEQVRFGYLVDGLARLPQVDCPLELFDEGICLLPHCSGVDTLQPLQVCKLEPGAKHRIGIDWKIVAHLFFRPGIIQTSDQTRPATASPHPTGLLANTAFPRHSRQHWRYPDAATAYCRQIPAKTLPR